MRFGAIVGVDATLALVRALLELRREHLLDAKELEDDVVEVVVDEEANTGAPVSVFASSIAEVVDMVVREMMESGWGRRVRECREG